LPDGFFRGRAGFFLSVFFEGCAGVFDAGFFVVFSVFLSAVFTIDFLAALPSGFDDCLPDCLTDCFVDCLADVLVSGFCFEDFAGLALAALLALSALVADFLVAPTPAAEPLPVDFLAVLAAMSVAVLSEV